MLRVLFKYRIVNVSEKVKQFLITNNLLKFKYNFGHICDH